MPDSFNIQTEEEQVPQDAFDFTGTHAKTDNEFKNSNGKISFAALRQGRKIPRLKKSMVLTIITGGILLFLITVNLLMQKKEAKKKYLEEQRNSIATGSEFSLGDLEKRSRKKENETAETENSDEFYFTTPPAYMPVLPMAAAASQPERRIPNTAPASSGVYYSESDLLAIKAQIGKEGGYGTIKPVSYNPHNSAAISPAAYYDYEPGIFGQMPTREEYTRQRIDEINRLTQTADSNANSNNGRFSDAGNYNPHNTQQGNFSNLNDECLFPGTIIHAILVSRIDTDYPGPIHARVTENVYDSMTGKNLLIPQGTILQGNYSSSSIGVAKVQIAWESMVVSFNGTAYQVSLGGMAGVDKRGRAGIAGTLDDHYFEWLKAAGIISLFTMLNSEISYQTRNQSSAQLRELTDINQGIVNKFADRLMERALDIQPTVRVANGTAVSVSVNAPLNLRPFEAIKAEEKWVRK